MERWSFAAAHVPSAVVLTLAVLALFIASAEALYAFRRARRAVGTRRAAWIFALRTATIVICGAIAFELTIRIDQISPNGRRVAVLVDRSASMEIADAPTADAQATTRQERLRALWTASEDGRRSWLEDGLTLDVRGFSDGVEPLSVDLAEALDPAHAPSGTASDLARALTQVADADGDRAPLAGVVVLSDGLVTRDEAGEQHLRALATSMGVPITTVALGAPAVVDVSVAEVRAGEFAFVENVVEFEATIVAHGLRGRRSPVILLRNGEPVAQRDVTLEADGIPQSVRFEVAPDRVGQFVYEIRVPEQPDEATVDNNAQAFVVKVLRDKVRVLHVAGRPDWDVRALRTLLRRDPNVELLSYYILRGFDDITREDQSAPLSLIPFPTDELFEQELGSFDLVVLHNFDIVQHQVGRYLDNIAEYVEEGGALVIIGGDLVFADGGLAHPELRRLLPVDTARAIGLQQSPYRPKITEAGARHPITSWLRGGATSWDQLPALDTFNRTVLSSNGGIAASALLVHPTDRDERGQPRPLLAVAEPGQGRVMVLSTGSSWRLGFAPDLPLIDGARPYDLLWLGAIRWLLHDDTSSRLTLETNQARYRSDEPVELIAKTVGAAYAPEANVEVQWEVVPLGELDDPLLEGSWTTDEFGRAGQRLDKLPVGAYVAIARRDVTESEGGGAAHEVRRVFLVDPPSRELAQIDADPGISRMAALAEQSGGLALSALEGDTLPRSLPLADPFDLPQSKYRVNVRQEVPLWNHWLTIAALLATLGGEWFARRRYGLR